VRGKVCNVRPRILRSRSAAAKRVPVAGSIASVRARRSPENGLLGSVLAKVHDGVVCHLSKLGWWDVALLEQTQLTAGVTWHAAGLTRLHQPHERHISPIGDLP